MNDNIQKTTVTIKKTVLRFTDSAIPYAWENYDPAQIEEQPDGSLLVTIHHRLPCRGDKREIHPCPLRRRPRDGLFRHAHPCADF